MLKVLADQAQIVIHQGSNSENVRGVDPRSDNFQTDFIVLKKMLLILILTKNILKISIKHHNILCRDKGYSRRVIHRTLVNREA
jgi:hypothetical protein